MSETQQKATGSFEAVGDDGKQYHIVEYTDFRHTTTAEITFGKEGVKEYKLGNGAPVRRISETEFEIESSGTKIRTG